MGKRFPAELFFLSGLMSSIVYEYSNALVPRNYVATVDTSAQLLLPLGCPNFCILLPIEESKVALNYDCFSI